MSGGAFYDRPVSGPGEDREAGRSERGRIGPAGIAAVVALPIVLAGNSLIVLLLPWLADFQYALPGFPDDPIGLAPGERIDLAREGIRSIWPVGPGSEILVEARLPGGGAAFGSDEVVHMEDVRVVVQGALALWLAGLVVLVASLTWVRTREGSDAVGRALRGGAVATVVALGMVGLLALISFDTFFRGFHDLLFEPGSWEFPADSTLIALYPSRFWATATGLLVGLTLIQAGLARLLPGRLRPD